MIKGEHKKEFYFTNDVFRKVSKDLKIPESIIKDVFNHFMGEFKNEILETDHLFYSLKPLGVLSINRRELDRNLRRASARHYKSKDEEEKAKFKRHLDNFKIRDKRMRVEEEKFKSIYPDLFSKTTLRKTKNAMFKPSKFEAKYYNNSISLIEASNLQNEYAQKWYKKINKPIAH